MGSVSSVASVRAAIIFAEGYGRRLRTVCTTTPAGTREVAYPRA